VDAADLLVGVLLIGAAGWIAWATIQSKRRASELEQRAETTGVDAAPQAAAAPQCPARQPAEAEARTTSGGRAKKRPSAFPRPGRRGSR
jgi:hypothetical protein